MSNELKEIPLDHMSESITEIADLKATINKLKNIIVEMDEIQSVALEQIGYLADMVGVASESPSFHDCHSNMTYCVMKTLSDMADHAKNDLNCLAMKRRDFSPD